MLVRATGLPKRKEVAEMHSEGPDGTETPATEVPPTAAWTPTPEATSTPAAPEAASAGSPGLRRGRLASIATSVAAIAVAAGAVGYALGNHASSPTSSASPFHNFFFPNGDANPGANGFGQFPFGSPSGPSATSFSTPAAVRNSEKALVDIQVSFNDSPTSGAGTGIVLSSNGVVLTNNHIVDGAATISVTDLGNGATYNATVLGYDIHDDLALIKLQGASGLQAAKFNTSPSVGERVYAIGNAQGSGGAPTVTNGTITNTRASVSASDSMTGTSETLTDMLQTNALVIPGDSGGALTSSSGAVLGIDTAGGSGGGFAIPASRALSIAQQIESGHVSATVHVGETAMLGVEISTSAGGPGAHVAFVVQGTPAARAGISSGATITAIGGRTITSSSALRTEMRSLRVGERVTVKWTTASGVNRSALVTLASGPAQ